MWIYIHRRQVVNIEQHASATVVVIDESQAMKYNLGGQKIEALVDYFRAETGV